MTRCATFNAMERMNFRDRLARHVAEDPDGCWLWEGGVKGSPGMPYGAVKYRRVSYLAHRLAYELLIGPIPEGMQLDHLCRVRLCFNPRHLEPVTPRENMIRGTGPSARNSVKEHCLHGHPLSGANLYVYTRSGETARACRACRLATCRKFDRVKRKGRWHDPSVREYRNEWRRRHRAKRRQMG